MLYTPIAAVSRHMHVCCLGRLIRHSVRPAGDQREFMIRICGDRRRKRCRQPAASTTRYADSGMPSLARPRTREGWVCNMTNPGYRVG